LHELPSLSARHLNTLLERYHTNTHILPFARECSQAAEQCIRGLLAVQLRARLTSVAHLKELPFFAGLDWEALFQMRIQAPLATVGLGPRISPQGRRAKPSSADISDAERRFSESEYLDVDEFEAGGIVDVSPGALCLAAAGDDIDQLRRILKAGGDVDAGDYDRRTAMHLASAEGKLEVVRFLVDEAGANHSPTDRWGGTPLDDAARHAHSAVVEYLASKGASVQAPTATIAATAEALAQAQAAAQGLAKANAEGAKREADAEARAARAEARAEAAEARAEAAQAEAKAAQELAKEALEAARGARAEVEAARKAATLSVAPATIEEGGARSRTSLADSHGSKPNQPSASCMIL